MSRKFEEKSDGWLTIRMSPRGNERWLKVRKSNISAIVHIANYELGVVSEIHLMGGTVVTSQDYVDVYGEGIIYSALVG